MITQLIIDSNLYKSTITETWLTIDDYALAIASQLTPGGFNVLLANRYTLHHRGGLALLFSSELKLILSSTPCFYSYEILICNIQFPSLFTIIIKLIYRHPSSSYFLADFSSILEYFTSVNTVILGEFNIKINNENRASLSLNNLFSIP